MGRTYFLLFVIGLDTYAAVVARPVLPATPLSLLGVAGQLLVRGLLWGEFTRILLVISRTPNTSPLTKFCLMWSTLAMVTVAFTFQLHPGPFSLVATGTEAICWYLAHRFITGRLYFIADLDAWRHRVAYRGQQPRPE